MGIYDKKLGEEIDKKDLGVLSDVFTGRLRLLKITYTFQDEEGVIMDSSLKHKDYQEPADETNAKVMMGDEDEDEEGIY